MQKKDFIQTLRLSNFRSYNALDVEFSGQPVVLFGDNGVGKTNLLEAISMLSPGRGLRGAKISDLAKQDAEDLTGMGSIQWGVSAQLGLSGHKIGTGSVLGSPNRRQMRIDGKNATGAKLAKLIGFSWLTPAHDKLFTGPASDRRRFFDRLCLVYAPAHGREYLAYEKARAERARLFADGIDDEYWFDALESDMAERGAKIAKVRNLVLQNLIAEIDNCTDGHFPKAILSLNGEAEALYAKEVGEAEISHFIKKSLCSDRNIDRRAGRTLRGVHKTDLMVMHKTKTMPAAKCSTGEQKALLIGLVLAHARSQKTNPPILLLDEVAAHLDEIRRAAMIEELLALGVQVFVTGTDKNLFSAFNGRAQVFEVSDGKLMKEDI